MCTRLLEQIRWESSPWLGHFLILSAGRVIRSGLPKYVVLFARRLQS